MREQRFGSIPDLAEWRLPKFYWTPQYMVEESMWQESSRRGRTGVWKAGVIMLSPGGYFPVSYVNVTASESQIRLDLVSIQFV
jgi:hypothetical protein